MARRNPLVCEYIEKLSSGAFERYKDIVRQMVNRRHGVYALYTRGKLYYVGLAKNLRSRVEHHLKDRHKGLWDQFSLYLTIDDSHSKELESLILRIARPKGNKQSGKFAKAQNLVRMLRRHVKAQYDAEWRSLTGREPPTEPEPDQAAKGRFAGVVSLATSLRARYKGEVYKARLRPNGTVRMGKKMYGSPTDATQFIAGRRINGWYFWTFQRAPGQWVRLREMRR